MRSTFAVVLLVPALAVTAAAETTERNWPQWRGPEATGVAAAADPPITWSESENVRVKVAVPGRGLASPIVWGETIFVLSAVPADAGADEEAQKAAAEKLEREEWPPSVEPVAQRFTVFAFSRRDGHVVWQRAAAEKRPHESHHLDSSWASASPATDGEVLVASFGSNGIFAYDLDGTLLWQKDLGAMRTRNGFGEGSSPAIWGDVVVLDWDHEGDSFVVALDKRTGAERWRTARPDEPTSWATPLVVEQGGRPQVVVAATGKSRGYDLATGAELWRLGGMTVNVIPSPVHRAGVVYLTSGFRGNMLQAVDLAKARGDLEGTDAVLWTHGEHTPYVPSPLLYDDKLYFLKRFGNILTCLDAATGKVYYTEVRVDGLENVYASPVGAAGRVYLVSREGVAVVLKHGETYEVLATNTLDDGFEASPAIAGDEIVLRGHRYLYVLARSQT